MEFGWTVVWWEEAKMKWHWRVFCNINALKILNCLFLMEWKLPRDQWKLLRVFTPIFLSLVHKILKLQTAIATWEMTPRQVKENSEQILQDVIETDNLDHTWDGEECLSASGMPVRENGVLSLPLKTSSPTS